MPGNNSLVRRVIHRSSASGRCLTIWDTLLQEAEPADAMAVARVHVRSWQTAYRTLIPDDYLDQLRPEDRATKYNFGSLDPLQPQTIVATEGGLISGFATTAPAHESDMPDYGELCALYVDPEQWGRGIGVALGGLQPCCVPVQSSACGEPRQECDDKQTDMRETEESVCD